MDIFIFVLSLFMIIIMISFYRLYKSIDDDNYDNDYFVLFAILLIIIYDMIIDKFNILFKRK